MPVRLPLPAFRPNQVTSSQPAAVVMCDHTFWVSQAQCSKGARKKETPNIETQASAKIQVQAPWRLHHSRLASLYMRPIRPIINVMVPANSAIISGMPKVVRAIALFSTGCVFGSGSIDSPASSSKVPIPRAPRAQARCDRPSNISARVRSADGGCGCSRRGTTARAVATMSSTTNKASRPLTSRSQVSPAMKRIIVSGAKARAAAHSTASTATKDAPQTT